MEELMQRRFAPIAFAALVALVPLVADAQSSDGASTERPFHVGIGGGIALELDRYPTQGVHTQEFGWHVMGTTDGPFIAISLAESFGNSVITFQVAPRFGWDIALFRGSDVGLLFAPSVAVGFAYLFVSVNTPFGGANGSAAFFDAQAAFDVKVLLLDEALELFARPVSVDVFVGDGGAAVRWNLLLGAHYRF